MTNIFNVVVNPAGTAGRPPYRIGLLSVLILFFVGVHCVGSSAAAAA